MAIGLNNQLPGLGNAAMSLGLTGMGDQAAGQTKDQEEQRKKKLAAGLDANDPLMQNSLAVQSLFGGTKMPTANGY